MKADLPTFENETKNIPPPPPLPNTNKEQIKALQEQITKLQNEEMQQDKAALLGTISKKVCALEVVKNLKVSQNLAIGGMAAPFILLLANTFNTTLGYGAAFLIVLPFAFFFYKVKVELQRLKVEYKI